MLLPDRDRRWGTAGGTEEVTPVAEPVDSPRVIEAIARAVERAVYEAQRRPSSWRRAIAAATPRDTAASIAARAESLTSSGSLPS